MHRRFNRWPTIPEIAKELGYSKMSVQHSLEQLVRYRYISVSDGRRGVPPRYEVHGFKVLILLDD